MRLIDADTIPELFDKEYKATRLLIEQGEEHLDNLAEGFTEAHHIIQKMPTIEAEPVKHGHWIVHKPFENGKDNCNECIECSECNIWFGHDCYSKTNYCPNCGAKMDDE